MHSCRMDALSGTFILAISKFHIQLPAKNIHAEPRPPCASERNGKQSRYMVLTSHHTLAGHPLKEKAMSLGNILLVVLVLMLLGAIPTWPHSRTWGYRPVSGLGLVVIVLVVLMLLGRI